MEKTAASSQDSSKKAFELKVSSDCMKVLLTCKNSEVDCKTFVQEIKDAAEELNIRAKFNTEALQKFIAQAVQKGQEIKDFVIAKGVPPVPSQDGRIEWQGEFFKEGYYIDPETKRIDFHKKAGDPSVEEGQLLAKFFKSVRGQDGIDVYGRKIKVAIPKTVSLNAGNNVVWDEKVSGFLAKKAGRVRYRGVTVHVDDTFIAREGVNTDTGNIKHFGSVIVNGDIDSEFVVEATGNIDVRGIIYASDIICGGNLTSKEGINENLKKKVAIKGDILAKYIMNARVECEGEIISNREIFQSEVKCRGQIHCKKGRIVGGEVMAAKGVFISEAGSKGDTKTVLIAGIDYYIKASLEESTRRTEQLKEQIKKIKPVYTKLKNMRQYLKPEQAEAMTELEFQINDCESELAELEEKSKELRKEYYASKNAKIVIYDMAYPGTVLRVFDSQYVIEEALKGPIVAGLDPATAEIYLSSELDNVE